MTTVSEGDRELPPLPEPAVIGDEMLDGYLDPDVEYTAEQMRAYGQQCWQAATQRERERAAQEAEHWQQIGRPDHKCGEYIAAAIRSIGKSQSNGRS